MSDIENEATDMIESTVSETETEIVTEDNTDKKKSYPTQMMLAIRALVGGYVLYLAYGLIRSNEKTPLIYAFIVLFVIAGILLIALSIRHYIRGEYEGGSSDSGN